MSTLRQINFTDEAFHLIAHVRQIAIAVQATSFSTVQSWGPYKFIGQTAYTFYQQITNNPNAHYLPCICDISQHGICE